MTTQTQAGGFGKRSKSTSTSRSFKQPVTPSGKPSKQRDESGDDGAASSDTDSYIRTGSPVFWRRFISEFIDGLILSAPMFLMIPAFMAQMAVLSEGDPAFFETEAGLSTMLPILLGYVVVYCIISFVYRIGFEASPWQATLGKKAIGIVVTDSIGDKPSLFAVILRNFPGKIISALIPLYIGYFIGLFMDDKKMLHDIIAGTTVRSRYTPMY